MVSVWGFYGSERSLPHICNPNSEVIKRTMIQFRKTVIRE